MITLEVIDNENKSINSEGVNKKMIKKKYICALDIGKFAVKMIGRDLDNDKDEPVQVTFRTKYDDFKIGDTDEATGNSYKLIYEGEKFLVGDNGVKKSNNTSKTEKLHKLCAYVAISNMLKENNEEQENEIYMFLACPITTLKNDKLKEEYKSFIANDYKPIEICVNNKNYKFTIKKIVIKAEGSGVIITEPKHFENKKTLVVDIGGLNLTVSTYNNFSCKIDDRFISEKGTNKLLIDIINQISIYRNGNTINEDSALKILEDGGMKSKGEIDENSIVYLDNAKEIFLNDILDTIKSWGIDIDLYDRIVFVGGTSQHLDKQISEKENLSHAVLIKNSNWTTAEGLYTLAYAKFKDLK